MKKFTKIMLITAGVIAIAGFGLSIGGVAMGASVKDPYVIEKLQRGLKYIKQADEWDDDYDIDLDDAWDDDEDWDERNSSQAVFTEEADGSRIMEISSANEIEIDLYYEELYLAAWDGDGFRVEIVNDENNKIQVTDNTEKLVIKGKKDKNESKVSLLYPKNVEIRKLDIEVDAGNVEFLDDLSVRELDMQMGTGNLLSDGVLTAQDIDMEVGLGSIHLSSLDATRISGECGLGTLEIGLTGKKDDYNYELECGAGHIDIGSETYSGLGGEKKIYNGAARTVELECGTGDILIQVED